MRQRLSFLQNDAAASDEAIRILKELTDRFPNGTWISSLRIEGRNVEMEGFSPSASELFPALTRDGRFRSVDFGAPILRQGENMERFKLRGEYVPPQKALGRRGFRARGKRNMNRMGEMLSRLRGMSPREKGLIAGCILLALGIAVTKGAAYPAYAQHKKNLAAIRQRVSTIGLYESYRKGQGLVDGEAQRIAGELGEMEKGLLEGENASAAGIFLQGLLKPLTQKPSTRMTAIRSLAPAKKGAYVEISVQLDLQTSTAELAQILAEVARQPKSLRVRKLYANTGMYPGRPMPGKEAVTVSMVVAGLSAAPFEEKAASEGGKP